jgi:hypothetical protein
MPFDIKISGETTDGSELGNTGQYGEIVLGNVKEDFLFLGPQLRTARRSSRHYTSQRTFTRLFELSSRKAVNPSSLHVYGRMALWRICGGRGAVVAAPRLDVRVLGVSHLESGVASVNGRNKRLDSTPFGRGRTRHFSIPEMGSSTDDADRT